MKCDLCNKEATVFFLQTLKNGETVRENLCEACAMSRGVTDAKLFLSPEDLENASMEETPQQEQSLPSPVTTPCPSCGFGAGDLENTQRFGCPDCYTHFQTSVLEMLEGIHRQTEHKGKLPEGLMQKYQLSKALEDTRSELSQAVKAEDYERAANLRDQLQELQQQLDLGKAS